MELAISHRLIRKLAESGDVYASRHVRSFDGNAPFTQDCYTRNLNCVPISSESVSSLYEYKGDGYRGVSIVDFGLTINVTDGFATVEFNEQSSEFYGVLKAGGLVIDDAFVPLDSDQLGWLDDSRTWVKTQIEQSQ